MHGMVETALDKVRGASRFSWLAMALAWALCVAGWALIMALPSKYEASTRLFVDTRTALSPVIQGLAIQDDMAGYLNLAKESLMAEAKLVTILERTGRIAPGAPPNARATAVDRLRDAIAIDVASPPGDRGQAAGVVYTIRYRDADRGHAIVVVRSLLESFVDDTLGGKREGSAAAEGFLKGQIAENEQRLREAEERLADFKRRNVGLMPGVEGDYFTRLQNELDAVRKARTDLSLAIARRQEIAKQRQGEVPYALGATAPGAAAAGNGAAPAGDTQTMIADAQRRLAALQLKYTDKHPEVVATREEVAELRVQRQRQLEALRRGDPDAMLESGAGVNPVYQSIQLALNDANTRVAELRAAVNQHEQKIAELRQRVNSVPEVEAEFARLNRDYEVTKAQYSALVDRLKKAQLGQDAEATSAVRFDVIDPPTAGFRPVSPDRPRLVIAVFVLACASAGLVMVVLNAMRPVINSPRELAAATDLPLLGEVCIADLAGYRASERRNYWKLAGGTACLVAAFGATLALTLTHAFA